MIAEVRKDFFVKLNDEADVHDRTTYAYRWGLCTMLKRRRERLRRKAADAKRRGDMLEQSRIRREMARVLAKLYDTMEILERGDTSLAKSRSGHE